MCLTIDCTLQYRSFPYVLYNLFRGAKRRRLRDLTPGSSYTNMIFPKNRRIRTLIIIFFLVSSGPKQICKSLSLWVDYNEEKSVWNYRTIDHPPTLKLSTLYGTDSRFQIVYGKNYGKGMKSGVDYEREETLEIVHHMDENRLDESWSGDRNADKIWDTWCNRQKH